MKFSTKEKILYASIVTLFLILSLTINPDSYPKDTPVTQGWLPAIALGASVLGSVFQGARQRRQARELERQNVRPTYTPDTNILQNQAIAQQMARAGLPDQVYNNQMNQIQQGFSTGLRQLGSRSTTPINVNSLVRNQNQAVGNLNAADAQARQQWTGQLMQANQAVAQENRQAFNINQLQPYQQNAQNVASMRRAGTQNVFGGLGMLAQGAMMGVFGDTGSGGLLQGLTDKLPVSQRTLNQVGGYRSPQLSSLPRVLG